MARVWPQAEQTWIEVSAVQPCAFSHDQPLAALGALSHFPAISFFKSSVCKLVQYHFHLYFCTLRACLCVKGSTWVCWAATGRSGAHSCPLQLQLPHHSQPPRWDCPLSWCPWPELAAASTGHKHWAQTGIPWLPLWLLYPAPGSRHSTAPQTVGLYADFQPIPPKEKDHSTDSFLFFLCWQKTL